MEQIGNAEYDVCVCGGGGGSGEGAGVGRVVGSGERGGGLDRHAFQFRKTQRKILMCHSNVIKR